jgi:hypothetical protein
MVYKIEPLDLKALFGPVATATSALTRLDERLARSPVQGGWIERQHFADAAAALWLEGELVHVEDLVLHDAHMDIRTPTHELTRAHAVLRARRQIAGHNPDWALGVDGLRQLTRPASVAMPEVAAEDKEGEAGREVAIEAAGDAVPPDQLSNALAEMDRVLQRSAKVLNGSDAIPATARPSLVYDLDWDEDARLAEWQEAIAATQRLPVVLRAAVLAEAWSELEVLQHAGWLGPLLVAALLRQEGVAAHHLSSWHLGAKQIPRERRRARDRTERLVAHVDAIRQGANLGMKEHDRLMLAKGRMERLACDRRTNSRLPEVIALVLSRPLVSSGMIQRALKVSKQGALNLVGELGLREMTGRGRYRAWGVV